MKTIEFMAKYRTGTGFITCKTTIAVRNIQHIQEVPPETPEYQDGIISRVDDIIGTIMTTEPYETLSARYNELMAEES